MIEVNGKSLIPTCRLAQYDNVSVDYPAVLTAEQPPYPRT